MKKTIFVLLLISAFASNSFSQDRIGMTLELGYQKYARSDFQNYLNAVSDSLGLGQKLKAPAENIIGLGYTLKKGGFEADLGAAFRIAFFQNISSGSNSANLGLSGFDLRLGANFYANKAIFAGFSLNGSSTSSKLSYQTSNAAKFGPTDDNSNIFKEYALFLRLQAGIAIPISKKSEDAIKLIPYYDLGISKWNFFESSDYVLTNYKGPKNTSIGGPGIKLVYQFAKNN